MHEYDFFTVIEISVENAQKKMKKFYIQINLKEKSSDSSSSENMKKTSFKLLFFLMKRRKIMKVKMIISLLMMSKNTHSDSY